MKKKIVVIGGGNSSALLIDALKPFSQKLELSAVVSASDSGGSSGALRDKFNILPPGDIMRAVVAMSRYEYRVLRQIFYKNRISGLKKLHRDLKAERGPNLGNLILALLAQYEGDFRPGIAALEQALEAVGHVYPASLKPGNLHVELSSGSTLVSEAAIDRPRYSRSDRIKRAWLKPRAAANPMALKVIKSADAIIFSPGSLYASLIATLLPEGIKNAIKNSKAKLVYVTGNAFECYGETGPERLSDFVAELERYLPRALDVVLYNSSPVTKKQVSAYRERKWGLINKDVTNIKGKRLIGLNLVNVDGELYSKKVGKALGRVVNLSKSI